MDRRRFLLTGLAIPIGAACHREVTPIASGAPAQPPETPISHAGEAMPPVGDRLVLTDDAWRTRLTRRQFEVLREHDTEAPFSSRLDDVHAAGTFLCAGCGAPLFASRDKFDSGTGWPSFTRPIEDGRVAEARDVSLAVERVEVRCARCDGHLGHVFPDGPAPTGMRYCINGVALEFTPGA